MILELRGGGEAEMCTKTLCIHMERILGVLKLGETHLEILVCLMYRNPFLIDKLPVHISCIL